RFLCRLATGPVTGGILNGSLVIDSQNADLTTRDVQSLAAQVAGRGIQSVSGSVEYVNSRSGFHQSRWPYSMPWNDFGKGWAPPSAPLMVNRDQATLSITAGNSGSPANISLTPGDVPIAIQNDTKTVSSGSPTVSVRLEFQSNTFVVSGSVPEGYRTSVKIAPPDPGLYAATVFEDALNQDNVAVSGVPTALQRAPGGSVVGSLPGTPVAHVVNQSLRLSSTAPSSQLERGLGSALGADLRAWAPPPADVPDFTGAGLQNYLTPDGLGRTLVQIYHNPSEASLVRLLSKQLWTAASPEQEEMVGYVQGPHHTVDAVVVLISGFGWNGHFTPTVGPAN
ncbi:MAG: D-alanyl-D-alanine carboxypeptidase, partial [Firmicutes bacterium]|nr:D-alanyl-D-alanine carboxypeptidase [Bacillota bacterium]